MDSSLQKHILLYYAYISESFCKELAMSLERDKRCSVVYTTDLPDNIDIFDAIVFIGHSYTQTNSNMNLSDTHLFLIATGDQYSYMKTHYEYNYVFIHPTDPETIAGRIRQTLFCDNNTHAIFQNEYFMELESTAGRLLKSIGVPLRLDGYYYLRFAIAYSYLKPHPVLNRDIYPLLESKYNKSAACIERSMRYAIELAWTHGDIDMQHDIFGYTIDAQKGKPVVREFVAGLADRMHVSVYSAPSYTE